MASSLVKSIPSFILGHELSWLRKNLHKTGTAILWIMFETVEGLTSNDGLIKQVV
jgi:hypothetical protein